VLSAWGLRGDVSIEVISTNPRRFQRGNVVYAGGQALTIQQVRQVSGKVVLGLREVTTRDEAEALQGQMLDVPATDLLPLQADEYYHDQILGLRVHTSDGRDLGNVTEILTTGANDVYVATDGTREYLLPAIGEVIRAIDLDRGQMTVDPLPGLFD